MPERGRRQQEYGPMRPTIVYAQSDAGLGAIHRQALQDAGYRVVPVHDGDLALSAAGEEGVDGLVLDAVLPRCDGYTVVERLRAGDGPGRSLPALLLCSGRVGPDARRRAEAMGDLVLRAKPIPLGDLVEQVGRLVKPVEGDAAAAANTASDADAERRTAPPGRGSLREVHFGALLHALHGARARGVLFAENGKKKKAIELRDGYPVAVRSNLVTECLGNMLARRGKLTQDVLDESLRRVKRGEGLQGEILVAMQVLDEETVAAALREQGEAKLLEIFEWRRGRYRFEAGKKLQRAAALALCDSPASLIWAAARRHVTIRRVDEFIAAHGSVYLTPAENPFNRFQSFEPSDEEAALIADLDPVRPLADYLDAPERVRRTLYALAITELVELSSEVAPAGPRPERVARDHSESEAVRDDALLRGELTALGQTLRDKNHYEVLGLPTIADDASVRTAYEQQIERVHPDRYRSSSGAVRQVADEIYRLFTRAYDALRDAGARAAYADELKRDIESQREQLRSRRILSAETAFQRGESALSQRDYEGALAFFGRALEQMPEEGLYHAYYGWCLHLRHPDNDVMIQEAIEHVREGMRLARDHELPYLFLGRLYKVLGKTEPAEKAFTRAVQLRPDCVEALRELRLLNMRRDKGRGLIGRVLKRR